MTEELIFIDPLSIGNPYYKQILIVVTTDYNTLVISCFISFFFFFVIFLVVRVHPQHTEVPRLGVELEL